MNSRLNKLVMVAISGALAFTIMLFEFALPIFPPFLRLDFSDIPALLVGFAAGPVLGLAVVGLRNLLHLTITATMGIGELANFLISGSLVFSASYFFKKWGKPKISLAAGSGIMVIFAVLANLFIVIPLYELILDLPLSETIEAANQVNPWVEGLHTYLALVIGPFNLLKAAFVSLLFIPVYKRLKRTSIYQKYQGS